MSLDAVTTRSAEALFRLAEREQAVDAVQGGLDRLGQSLSGPAASAWLIASGQGAKLRKQKLLQAVAGAHALVQNFVGLAVDKGRAPVLLQAHEAFRQRCLLAQGVLEGVVEAPRPLADADVQELARALGRDLGKEVRLQVRENADLIGGVRVVVGARMLDRSVQGRLEALRQRMIAARLPARSV